MSVIDRNVTGAAAQVRVAVALASGESGTMVVDVSTGWPSTHFVAVIDRSTADEEKVLLASRSGNVWTIAARGFDGTSARDHAEGATVELILDAVMIQAFLDHVNANLEGDVHEQYLLAADLTKEAIDALEVDAHTLGSHTWDDVVDGLAAVADAAAAASALVAAVETELTPAAPSLTGGYWGDADRLASFAVADYPAIPADASTINSRLYISGFFSCPLAVNIAGSFYARLVGRTSGTVYWKSFYSATAAGAYTLNVPIRNVFTDASKETLDLERISGSSPVLITPDTSSLRYSVGARWVGRP